MDAADLNHAAAVADAASGVGEAAEALRRSFPALRVRVVDAMDMREERPAAQGRLRTLWLGASDGHCWRITPDPAEAAALFIAEGGAT